MRKINMRHATTLSIVSNYSPPTRLKQVGYCMLLLNQARAGLWPARAWFIEITSVRMYACVYVCVSAPLAMNN